MADRENCIQENAYCEEENLNLIDELDVCQRETISLNDKLDSCIERQNVLQSI